MNVCVLTHFRVLLFRGNPASCVIAEREREREVKQQGCIQPFESGRKFSAIKMSAGRRENKQSHNMSFTLKQ